MPDISHMMGGGLSVGPSGDLALVDGFQRGVQRILRRLLTNQGDYIWQLPYGAGLPKRVGSLIDIPFLTSLVRSQIFLEASVARDPAPIITVSAILNGAFCRIQYTDSGTGQQKTLSFEVT